ncbi:hypothetical protein [Clostridium sporogenes]|uniref:hypothetical protein n=1 Tax=Clostridium sporogenes TaxID=1509 RepID=UPI002237B67A|nr:hypothetical protein [Clostridium sporogenes]MCW6109113.1 hypothetical protein [Clostridium sporogenes]
MNNNFFHGYNCFSAALGEYAKQKNKEEINKIILSQLTFMFSKELFWANSWFGGSTLLPVDNFIKQDLERFANITITEDSSTDGQAIEQTKKSIEKNGFQIILVDFYYIKSVNWDILKRYNILPEHDAHFIIITSIDERQAGIIDPYYNYQGTISIDDLNIARGSKTRQGVVNYNSYEINLDNVKSFDLREVIKFRFERFLNEKMYYLVEQVGVEIDRKRLIEGKNQNRIWSLSGYNCLRSSLDQYSNLKKIKEMYEINMPDGLNELENQWALIRKKLIEFYHHRLNELEEVSYLLLKTAQLEKSYANKVLNTVL